MDFELGDVDQTKLDSKMADASRSRLQNSVDMADRCHHGRNMLSSRKCV